MYAVSNPTNTRYNAHISTATHETEIMWLGEKWKYCNTPAADDL